MHNVGNFFHTAFNVSNQLGDMYNQANLKVIDFLTGYSSMWSNLQTLFNGKASLSDKGWAAGDLVLNAGMDVLMFTGIGEVVRGADVGVRITDDVFTGVKDVLSHACSFTARTLVATAHSEQPIGTLHVGDKVWAYNPQTHKMEMQPILQVWVHTDNDLIDLTIATPPKGQHGASSKSKREVVHTNQKHPFLTTEYGFVPVGQIKVGMHVVRADGSIGVITRWTIVPGVKMMYNLEVAQDHTFTVGDGQWVVHNCGGFSPDILSNTAKADSGKNGLTNVGRALQKHLDPGRFDAFKWSPFKPLLRNPSGYNVMGEHFIDDLITNPKTIWKIGGGYINGWEGVEEGARGAEWLIHEGVVTFSGLL